jgi:16S rRNA processing protein RimM
MKSYFKLGKIVAAHGLKGELVLQHELGKKTDLKKLPALFLELKKDSFVPYFIRKAKGTTEKESLLLLEEIDTREKAQQLVGNSNNMPINKPRPAYWVIRSLKKKKDRKKHLGP